MTIDKNNLPNHIAIILDGNGRWATQRNLPRSAGHDQGLKTIKRIVKTASDLGIKHLTLYVFSTENWKRTEQEVGFLMNLIHIHLRDELNFYKENQIRINHLGNIKGLPQNIQEDIINAMADTKDFTGLTVNLCINYGGRDEILRGIKNCFNTVVNSENIEKGISQNLSIHDIINRMQTEIDSLTESDFSKYLDMPLSPDVDLVLRTGGEQRLSNFLLWHVPYAEFVYSNTLWPDFTDEEFFQAIEQFQHRSRRFGAEKPSKNSSSLDLKKETLV